MVRSPLVGAHRGWLALVGFGLHRLSLLWAWKHGRYAVEPTQGLALGLDAPFVTVQLPIYNERFVAARLIDAAAALGRRDFRLEDPTAR
ncbi:MAG: hypothetical protein U0527_12645 [Candidatus Eisenbacteria bacterium]